jgi:N-methylhydantoinase A
MEATARKDMNSQGLADAEIRLERHGELRYLGQAAEVAVAIGPDDEPGALIAYLPDRFAKAHEEAFGHSADAPVELVSLRLRALAKRPGIGFAELAERLADHSESANLGPRLAYFGPDHGEQLVPVVGRWAIDGVQTGPLIVEEPDTTVVVPPKWTVRLDERGTAVLRKES